MPHIMLRTMRHGWALASGSCCRLPNEWIKPRRCSCSCRPYLMQLVSTLEAMGNISQHPRRPPPLMFGPPVVTRQVVQEFAKCKSPCFNPFTGQWFVSPANITVANGIMCWGHSSHSCAIHSCVGEYGVACESNPWYEACTRSFTTATSCICHGAHDACLCLPLSGKSWL